MLVKIIHDCVAFNPIASYCSIKRLALIYLSYAQQDHKLNENGMTVIFIRKPR
jgi:hypothetical protein